MKKNINMAAMFMLSVLLVGACRKGKNDVPSARIIKLKTISHSTMGTYTYAYDALGRMQTEVYTGNVPSANRNISFKSYDGKGRLLEMLIDLSGTTPDVTHKMTYEGDKLVRVDYETSSTGAGTGYVIFKYPSANQIIGEHYNATGILRYRDEYTYDAGGKNLMEYKYVTAAGVNEFTTTYLSYDDKRKVDNLFPVGYLQVGTAQNNYLSYVDRNLLNGRKDTMNFIYEYNAEGYPTKRTAKSGAVTTYEYTYP